MQYLPFHCSFISQTYYHLVSTIWICDRVSFVLRMSNTLFWVYSPCLSTHPLMETGVVLTYWLQWIMLQWTGQCKYLSQVLVFIIEWTPRSCMFQSCRVSNFEGRWNLHPVFHVVAQFDSTTQRVQGLPFPTCSPTLDLFHFHFLSFYSSHPARGEVIY